MQQCVCVRAYSGGKIYPLKTLEIVYLPIDNARIPKKSYLRLCVCVCVFAQKEVAPSVPLLI